MRGEEEEKEKRRGEGKCVVYGVVEGRFFPLIQSAL